MNLRENIYISGPNFKAVQVQWRIRSCSQIDVFMSSLHVELMWCNFMLISINKNPYAEFCECFSAGRARYMFASFWNRNQALRNLQRALNNFGTMQEAAKKVLQIPKKTHCGLILSSDSNVRIYVRFRFSCDILQVILTKSHSQLQEQQVSSMRTRSGSSFRVNSHSKEHQASSTRTTYGSSSEVPEEIVDKEATSTFPEPPSPFVKDDVLSEVINVRPTWLSTNPILLVCFW